MKKNKRLNQLQLTEKEALAVYESGIWKQWTDEEVVRFQIFQSNLCMPWDRYRGAMAKVLGRPVFTHEFARASLQAEYLKKRSKPTMQEVIDLIPVDKRTIILDRP